MGDIFAHVPEVLCGLKVFNLTGTEGQRERAGPQAVSVRVGWRGL